MTKNVKQNLKQIFRHNYLTELITVLILVRNIDDFAFRHNINNLHNTITSQSQSQMLCDAGYRVYYIYTFFYFNLSQYFMNLPLTLITALQQSHIDFTHFNCSQ